MGPNIALVFDGESGTFNTLTVLTTDQDERHRGLAVIQELRAELEIFEELISKRLLALRGRQ